MNYWVIQENVDKVPTHLIGPFSEKWIADRFVANSEGRLRHGNKQRVVDQEDVAILSELV